jgi:sec-independent protein translocase protein TatA
MMGLGWQELTIILIIVVIVFGAGKLPEVGGALGRGIKEFKTQSTAPDEELPAGSTTTTTTTTATRVDEPVVVEKREMRPDEI